MPKSGTYGKKMPQKTINVFILYNILRPDPQYDMPDKRNAKDFYTVRCKICGALLPDEKCPVCSNCGWSKCA